MLFDFSLSLPAVITLDKVIDTSGGLVSTGYVGVGKKAYEGMVYGLA